MITQFQIPGILREKLPNVIHFHECRPSLEAYTCMHDLTDYTKHAVNKHNLGLAKKCFSVADQLYHYGDASVKNLVENNFIFSMSSFMPSDTRERIILKSIIPKEIYMLYLKQVMQSGC